MGAIEDIVHSDQRPKAKQKKLVDAACGDGKIVKELMDFFQSASDVDKGICADAMKHASERKPGLLAPYIDTLIEHVSHKAPRVRRGVQEAIGNIAREYPVEAAKAIPSLLRNTEESKTNTTVVRWCAAYGLSEIAKHCPAARGHLVPAMGDIAEREGNNGVRNVYLKALKELKV